MILKYIFLLQLLIHCSQLINAYPTLPTRWISITKEPGAPGDGVGLEAYKYVDKPTPDNPSAIWSNYTGCARLILINNNYDAKRYLLGCDAVDCCTEEQDGNHVEFQIPNIHTQLRKINIEQGKDKINVFGKDIETDSWTWKFLGQNWTAYTTYDEEQNPILHRWESGVVDVLDVSIDFKNFTAIKNENEIKEFDNLFKVPEVCLSSTVQDCGDNKKKKFFQKMEFDFIEVS